MNDLVTLLLPRSYSNVAQDSLLNGNKRKIMIILFGIQVEMVTREREKANFGRTIHRWERCSEDAAGLVKSSKRRLLKGSRWSFVFRIQCFQQ